MKQTKNLCQEKERETQTKYLLSSALAVGGLSFSPFAYFQAMGKLTSSTSLALSSLILRSIVDSKAIHSSFHSSFSCPFTTFTTHIKTICKNSVRVKGKGKKDVWFDNVDDAHTLFNQMFQKYPRPSIVDFTKILSAIVRMKHYAIVVSLCNQMELLRVPHNVYSLSILINCFCLLDRVDFGFSILGKMLKLGIDPNVVTL
ncbi:hypothetical protein DITRI_Ditri17bG0018400 [Diplodiscus trichospermus]